MLVVPKKKHERVVKEKNYEIEKLLGKDNDNLKNEEYDCISCIGDSFIINTYELNIYNQKRISNAYEHVKRSINEAIKDNKYCTLVTFNAEELTSKEFEELKEKLISIGFDIECSDNNFTKRIRINWGEYNGKIKEYD